MSMAELRQEIARRGERVRAGADAVLVFVIRQDFDWYYWIAQQSTAGETSSDSFPRLNSDGNAYYVVTSEERALRESPPWFITSPGFLSEETAMAWADNQPGGRIYWNKAAIGRQRRGTVFLSYMREDATLVDRIADALRNQDIPFWLDREAIAAGQMWESAIAAAIDRGGLFVACFSRRFDRAKESFMQHELSLAIAEMAKRHDISFFVPVTLDGTPIPELPIAGGRTLGSIQWIDYSNPIEGQNRLFRKIGGNGIVLGSGSFESRLHRAATLWANDGRRRDYTLSGDAMVVAQCWAYANPASATSPVSEYIAASRQAIGGDNGWSDLLLRRVSCAICGETWRVENAGICTDCLDYFCSGCDKQRAHRGACNGQVVG